MLNRELEIGDEIDGWNFVWLCELNKYYVVLHMAPNKMLILHLSPKDRENFIRIQTFLRVFYFCLTRKIVGKIFGYVEKNPLLCLTSSTK